jgi:hypothetical protein
LDWVFVSFLGIMRTLQLTIACRGLGAAAQELSASWQRAAGAQARQHSKVSPMRAAAFL